MRRGGATWAGLVAQMSNLLRHRFPTGRACFREGDPGRPAIGAAADRKSARPGWLFRLALCTLCLLPTATPAQEERPATLQVSGYGFRGNRDLHRTLRMLLEEKQPPPHFDANFVEDAALILFAKLTGDGYLEPRLRVVLTLDDGSVLRRDWDRALEPLLPRPLKATRVQFRIQPGRLSYYERVEIRGLKSLPVREARRYFLEADLLIPTKGTRVFTPARLEQSLGNLRDQLARKGFEEASVTVAELERDDPRGAVRLRVAVNEGLPSIVRSVRVEVFGPGETEPRATAVVRPGKPYSRHWAQDFAHKLRREQYRLGFPDATAQWSTLARESGERAVFLDLLARVETGPHITLGTVRFEGHEKTREYVLRRRVRLEEGKSLDSIRVDRGRHRLARLGIFEIVDQRYEETDEQTRDVVYAVKEGKRIDLSLLGGYGSYELLRGGFELDQYNLFGLAHRSRLRGIQSFKSTSADYLYQMPDLIGEEIDLFFKATGLRRDEVSFTREEFGASVGGQHHFPAIASDIGLRYSYEFLDARGTGVELTEEAQRARVAALVLDVKHDRRDNPLAPRRGFKLFGTVELASEYLGGEVDYQRFEVGTSVHQKLGGGRYLHLGATHGVALTWNGEREELPFNKRYFPGGETSIRGYQQGEASPRNADGKIIGAESYVLGNVEFEQALTRAWSVVGFVDALGIAADVGDYPASRGLYSAGGGLRWQTIVGPARLEYGHNLNPRRKDPRGTLHVSIGFPF